MADCARALEQIVIQDLMQYTRGSLTFNVLELGPRSGEAIVLLHGFPANAMSWIPTAERLAANGYRILIPQQRGYSKGARPSRRSDYKLSELVEDIAVLLDTANVRSAHIVGHDWGGVVAWVFAHTYSDRTLSLISISTPHPKALLRSLFSSKQIFLSWYMLFFQLPWLPEWVMTREGGRTLKKLLVGSGLSALTASSYVAQLNDVPLATGALNWYRALPFSLFEVKRISKIQPATLFIHGEQDAFLSKQAAQATKKWVDGRYVLISQPNMSHWIPEEAPEWLADQINTFIRQ